MSESGVAERLKQVETLAIEVSRRVRIVVV